MDLSIVIPALNERAKIVRDLEAASAFLAAADLSGEIIVVVDGSDDDTAALVEAFAAVSSASIRLLPPTMQRGKGAAIARGVDAARGDVVMFADAGLCVPYEDALQGLALLRTGIDLAHGSRSLPQTVVFKKQPLWRQAGSRAFRWLIHTAMGIPRDIGDTQCGFKLYRPEVARELYGALTTPGYMFDIEIILRAVERRYRIGHFPVRWSNDEDSRFQPLSGPIGIARSLIGLRLRLAAERRATRSTTASSRVV